MKNEYSAVAFSLYSQLCKSMSDLENTNLLVEDGEERLDGVLQRLRALARLVLRHLVPGRHPLAQDRELSGGSLVSGRGGRGWGHYHGAV